MEKYELFSQWHWHSLWFIWKICIIWPLPDIKYNNKFQRNKDINFKNITKTFLEKNLKLYGVEAIKDSEVTKSVNGKGKYDTIHKNIFIKNLSHWENTG